MTTEPQTAAQELRRLAEAAQAEATWEANYNRRYPRRTFEVETERAAFRAAVSPDVVLALLDRAEAAEKALEDAAERVRAEAPVHVQQQYTATDHGSTEYRPDDCLYRGDVLAILESPRP
jgi:hypothetical protein